MIKIINGKIVQTQVIGGSSSPIMTPRRRSSLQELQLKEFQLQQELKQKEAAAQQEQEVVNEVTPSWHDLSCQSIRVFGMKVNIKVLLTVAILSVIGAGIMGLLCTLLTVYLGTLFIGTSSTSSSSPGKTASPSPPSSPVEQDTRNLTPPSKASPINAAHQILTRRNSINNGIIVARPSSPLSSPNMRSPRFATLRSISEVERLPMLDTPAC